MNFLLFLLSFPYRWGCQLKNFLYNKKILNPKKAPLPIISIGNISFGGSEKTPLTMNVISFLLDQGFKPALISRGYKGKWEKKGGVLSDGRGIMGSWEDSGDEAFMIAQNIPQLGIFIGKNRLISSEKAFRVGFDVGVLEDGFQHRFLHRDMDIVLCNPAEKIALREPFSSVKRADLLLIKRREESKKQEKIKKHIPETSIFEYTVKSQGIFRSGKREVSIPAEKVRREKVIAFCGIAHPERFSSLLQKEGISPEALLKFPDHHSYPQSSIQKIVNKFQKIHADALITTEKDAVKIANVIHLKMIPVYYLKIDLEVEKGFYETVLSLLKNKVSLSYGKL